MEQLIESAEPPRAWLPVDELSSEGAARSLPAASLETGWPLQPNSLGMIGQDSLVETIDELITYCLAQKIRFPDRCFVGSAGVGKSSMARAIAQKLATECLLLNGADMSDASVLISAIADHGLYDDEMVNGAYAVSPAIIFIDEAHSMPRRFVAWLLSALDDARTTSHKGKRYFFGDATFILATTDPGRLPATLRSRAEPIYLRQYTLAELAGIVWLHALKALDHELPRDVCEEIAARMRANPRRSVRAVTQAVIPHAFCQLKKTCSEPTRTEVAQSITTTLIARYYDQQGIDVNGLDDSARDLLRYLDRHGATPEERLCQALGISTRSDFLSLDEYLMRLGLVSVTTRGRQLTTVGRRYVHRAFPLRANIGSAHTQLVTEDV